MTWTKLCDTFWSHPKVIAVGNEGAGAFARMLSYAGAQLTDGHIPEGVAGLITTRKVLRSLVENRLLEQTESGYQIHDFLSLNPSRKNVELKQEDTRSRVAEWRENKAKAKARNAVCNAVTTPVSNSVGNAVGNASPDPTRPVPSVSPTGDTPPTPSPGVRAGEGGAPRLGTVEREGFRSDELAALLRERAKGRVLAAGADGRVLVQLQRAMDDAARGGATRASYETLADWYAAGSQGWRTRKPLGLAELATAPGTLAEHLEAAQRWHDEGRPAIAHGDPKRRGPAPPSRFDGRDYEGDARRLAEAEAEAERAFNALPG